MNNETKKHITVSFPTLGILGVLFVALKLTGYIHWSWWWVTAPFWGPWALLALFFAVGGLVFLTTVGVAWWLDRRRAKKRAQMSRAFRVRY